MKRLVWVVVADSTRARLFGADTPSANRSTNKPTSSLAPSMSIVYYTMDGDDILFSTMAGRQKAKAVKRLGELSLCILDGQWPPTYIVVDGKAAVEEDIELVTDVGMAIGSILSGETLPDEVRPLV